MTNLPSSANVFSFIKQATKAQGKLRLALSGPSGSGKTFTAINVLAHMGCKKILVLDSEHGSAAKYSNEFPVKFDAIDNEYWQSKFDPRRLIAVLKQVASSYDGLVCDSLTHFWMGPGGMLTLVDDFAKKAQARGGKYDSFGAWKEADPIYNDLVQTILALPCHFVACLRAKSDYEDVVENGKKKKVKVGMASQMREGFEYEFDVEGMLTMSHDFIVGKTRCRALDEQIISKPGANLADPLLAWLTDGEPEPPVKAAPVAVPVQAIADTPPEVSERVPDTNRNAATEPQITAAPEVEPAADTLESLLAKIAASSTLGDLKAAAEDIKQAHKTKIVSAEDYNSKLSPAYSARQKELKAAGQVAA